MMLYFEIPEIKLCGHLPATVCSNSVKSLPEKKATQEESVPEKKPQKADATQVESPKAAPSQILRMNKFVLLKS